MYNACAIGKIVCSQKCAYDLLAKEKNVYKENGDVYPE